MSTTLTTTPRLSFVQRSALALLVLSGAINTIVTGFIVQDTGSFVPAPMWARCTGNGSF